MNLRIKPVSSDRERVREKTREETQAAAKGVNLIPLVPLTPVY